MGQAEVTGHIGVALGRMRTVERVLLIRLTALGDVVLLTPAIRALKQAHPQVRVDLVTDARYADFAQRFMAVNAVIPYDRHGEHAGYSGVAQVKALLPDVTYDAVADLQGKLRTRALARRIKARHHVVLNKRTPAQALLSVLGHDPPIQDRRAAQLYVQALEPLGVDPQADLRTELKRPARTAPEGPRWVGLSAGASHATKLWPVQRFTQLALALSKAQDDLRFVLIGGPGDRAQLEALRAALPNRLLHAQDVSQLDVSQLAERIAGLHLMVSVDTGPAHMAAAFAVPTVALFGPTAASRWGPVGAEHRAITLGLDCAPCSNTGGQACPQPERNHACMQELPVEEVLGACLEILQGGEG